MQRTSLSSTPVVSNKRSVEQEQSHPQSIWASCVKRVSRNTGEVVPIEEKKDNEALPEVIIHKLGGDGSSSIEQYPSLQLSLRVDNDVFEELWRLKGDNRGTITLYGKTHPLPRYQLHLGRSYYYSGEMHESTANIDIHPHLLVLQQWVRNYSGQQKGYDQMLINFYEDGNDHIGQHSDDESQLVPGSDIFSFSFGAERQFVVKNKGCNTPPFKWQTKTFNNSLIIMKGAMQRFYTHGITATKRSVGRRINVTMRNMKSIDTHPLPPSPPISPSVRVINRRHTYIHSKEDVYIGRPSVYGNPFVLSGDGDRDIVVERHRAWLWNNKQLLYDVRHEMLKGQKGGRLVCWCAPDRCHGDNYIEILSMSDAQFNALHASAS